MQPAIKSHVKSCCRVTRMIAKPSDECQSTAVMLTFPTTGRVQLPSDASMKICRRDLSKATILMCGSHTFVFAFAFD